MEASATPHSALSGQDSAHLTMLAIFHHVLAAFTFLFGCLPAVHLVMGLVMLTQPERMQQRDFATRTASGPSHEEMQEDVLFEGVEADPELAQPQVKPDPEPWGDMQTPPPDPFFRVIGGVLAGIAALMILLAWTLSALLVVAGRALQKRRRHLFCQVIAGISCLLFPVGTVLGVFTFIVLQRPAVAAAFRDSEAA